MQVHFGISPGHIDWIKTQRYQAAYPHGNGEALDHILNRHDRELTRLYRGLEAMQRVLTTVDIKYDLPTPTSVRARKLSTTA